VILITAFNRSVIFLLLPFGSGILTYLLSTLLQPLRLKFAVDAFGKSQRNH
jgi:hypothetical protein